MSGFLVAQLGARMHYAIPVMLARRGLLDRFYTDFCLKSGAYAALSRLNGLIASKPLRQALRRRAEQVPDGRIHTFPSLGVEYALRLRRAHTPQRRDETFLWANKAFAANVLAQGFRTAQSLYVFNTAGLELLRAARRAGLSTVVEQTIAPRALQRELMAEERARHPGWEPETASSPAEREMIEREFEEWAEADTVLCASPFVRDGVVAKGGDPQKCAVVPYGFDRHHGAMPPELDGVPARRGPLNVLVVGGVGLRKGTPDLLRAAELLGASARFRLVGPLVASPRALAGLPANVEIVGHKPFAELVREYRAADVFLLPSICEGSATSIYEAMSFGLPIVCTPHCGSVVRDGVEGFIVPIRDPEAIARCLSRLAAEPHERAIMGYRAAARAAEFDLEAYGKRLFAVIGREG